jgi:hypothetical protein
VPLAWLKTQVHSSLVFCQNARNGHFLLWNQGYRSVVSEPEFLNQRLEHGSEVGCMWKPAGKEEKASNINMFTASSVMLTMCLSLAVMQMCNKALQTVPKPFPVISLDIQLS